MILEIDPHNKEAHYFLAKIYQTIHDDNKAITHLEKLLSTQKGNLDLIKLLIKLYLKEKLYPKAESLLISRIHWYHGDINIWTRFKNWITKQNPNQKEYEMILFQIIYIQRESEKYKSALKYAKKLIKSSNTPIHRYILATIYEAMNDIHNAQKEFAKINQNFGQFTIKLYEQLYKKCTESELIPNANSL